MSFIKAMQFALTEYICVSSEEQNGSSSDDDIHACASNFFHKQVIFDTIITFFFSYLNYILFRLEILRSAWEVVSIRSTRQLPTMSIVQNVW